MRGFSRRLDRAAPRWTTPDDGFFLSLVSLRIRQAVDFAVRGDVRFLSHRDMLRMFARAVVRARLPVRYSEGFNPRPKLMLPIPRPVGIESVAERLVMDMTDELDDAESARRLAEQMPRGVEVLNAGTLNGDGGTVPVRVRYLAMIPTPDRVALDAAIRDLAARAPEPVMIERADHKRGRSRSIDIAPYIGDVRLVDEGIDYWLTVTGSGTAKPAELCTALGVDTSEVDFVIRRLEIEWQ